MKLKLIYATHVWGLGKPGNTLQVCIGTGTYDAQGHGTGGPDLMINLSPNKRIQDIRYGKRVLFSRIKGARRVHMKPEKVRRFREIALIAIAARAMGHNPTFEIDL